MSLRRSCRRFYFLQKGHGLSGHKSVDGPPQLLAEYAYYVVELVEALRWGGGVHGGGDGADGGSVSASAGGDMVGGKKTNDDDEERPKTTKSSASHDDDDDDDDENDAAAGGENDKIILVGHSMGSGVSVVLTASFPEWVSALILLEGGLVARDAGDASRHVRAACQRRLRSNRTLFPNAGGGGGPGMARGVGRGVPPPQHHQQGGGGPPPGMPFGGMAPMGLGAAPVHGVGGGGMMGGMGMPPPPPPGMMMGMGMGMPPPPGGMGMGRGMPPGMGRGGGY